MKRLAAVVLLTTALGGCADPLRGMRAVPASQQVTTTPPSGKGAIIFLRPSHLISPQTASVFELKKDGDVFIGHVRPYTKLVYFVDAGATRFMVIGGGTADFLNAEFDAGKTYYALVTTGTGGEGPVFSFQPVTRAAAENLSGWLQESAWIENTPQAQAWAKARWNAIQTRKRQYLVKWETQSDKPTLRASDGR